jgi:hypothetical protein
MTRIEIGQISGIGRSMFVICLVAGAIVTAGTHHPAGIIAGALLGLYLMFALKVVQQWEKVAVLRLAVTSVYAARGFFTLCRSSRR